MNQGKSREEKIQDIKTAIQNNRFNIGNKIYAPLHTTSYPLEILKELEKNEFLLRCGTLKQVLNEHGLTHQYYKKMRGAKNSFHWSITCFKVLKEII